MKTALETPDWEGKYRAAEERAAAYQAEIEKLNALVKYYEEQFRLSQQRRYGRSSEKTDPVQMGLFNEAEAIADPDTAEPEYEEIKYKRRKRKGKRKEDLSKLPVEVIEHTLPECHCPECGGQMHVMGHKTHPRLKIIPAQVKVEEHRQAVYSCRNCEKTGDQAPIVQAPMPVPVISNSLASPSAVAHIMTQKFVMYSPLYRQEQEWARQGAYLSRQTMANWVIRCSEDWLMPVYERLRERLLSMEVLHADETVLQVLHEPGRAAQTNSYMWLYRTSGDVSCAIVLYAYRQTHSASHPVEFLNGFNGFLHTDGYQAYHALDGVIIAGCWSHMRRKFEDALKTMPKAERPGSSAAKGEAFCNRLFDLERGYASLPPAERHEKRLSESLPVANQFFAWAESLPALPKTVLGQALQYAANQRQWLMNVYLDGRLELSNNRAERSIKPFVMGRKNFLFCNTPKGAQASAVVYSIIETAKENGLKPFEYLEYIFETLPNNPENGVDSVLPWSPGIPAHCKMPATNTPPRDPLVTVEKKERGSNAG